MKRHLPILFIVLILLIAGMFQVTPAKALNVVSGSITLTCTSLKVNTKYNVDRDNTGKGLEHYGYLVVDGFNNGILAQEFTDTFSGADNFTLTFSKAPKANPINAEFVSFGGNGQKEIIYRTANIRCPGLPDGPGLPGAPLPAGFVLRTITCDVAVYATPGGIPVITGEAIKNGQTWYVNPIPVKDRNGKLWTELFPSGYTNGFIPTSCVGGKPAGYTGN